MPDYGVTSSGLNIKRLDTITQEIHEKLTSGWGVNTQLNPSSFLNVLVTDMADKIAELWELGASIYYAMYPSTAEGVNLDYAAQLGGSTRELAARSYYPIHCKGTDGTTLAIGTTIGSSTNPAKYFNLTEAAQITRQSFNEAAVSVASAAAGNYTISLNGSVFTYTAASGATVATILAGLKTAITDATFTCTVNADNTLLTICAVDKSSSNILALSDNLTTSYVVSIITFASEEAGDIVQPDNTITNIVTAVSGLTDVWNSGTYIAGHLRETDEEFRASYVGKIYSMSSRMCDSIVSALLNVQGVESAAAYENATNYTTLTYTCDGTETSGATYYFLFEGFYYSLTMPSVSSGDTLTFDTEHKSMASVIGGTSGTVSLVAATTEPATGTDITDDFVSEIYPHSVEAVVDGGSDAEVAQTILDTKTAGINTFGSVSVEVPDAYDSTITVRFNRPTTVYIWYKVVITQSSTESLPPNYSDLIEDVILDKMSGYAAGTDVTPQKWMSDIYNAVTGIAYIDITMAETTDPAYTPESSEYTLRSVEIAKREKAVSDDARIGVTLSA